jgi:hypothetical protein
MRAHVLGALARYWPADSTPISKLPLKTVDPQPAISLPLHLQPATIPHWAAACAVDGQLLVPAEAIPKTAQNSEHQWPCVDWILAAFLLLEGWHERLWEHQHGPVHSYSFRLTEWDERAWQHAWVNRIGLFLRQWAIEQHGPNTAAELGDLPVADIQMTHDVDAVRKTLPIRLKQGAFNLFNAARALRRRQPTQAGNRLGQATRFLLGRDDWWVFDRLLADEQSANIRATWHFHADPRAKTPKRWLFDPGYAIQAPAQRRLLQQLGQAGHRIGLHPGFDTWQSQTLIAAARHQLEQAAGGAVTHCRQHWLRFSWKDTWHAQANAGLMHDTTLMFNDRPGYRTSSALAWQPWNQNTDAAHRLTALPTVLMDSHCYDYQLMTTQQRQQAIEHWLGECQAVHGQVAVLWHPHTLSRDYGWSEGFNDILASVKENHA